MNSKRFKTFFFSLIQTGTLTEDGLDLQCVLPIVKHDGATTNEKSIEFGNEVTDVSGLNWREQDAHSMIIVCMAGMFLRTV